MSNGKRFNVFSIKPGKADQAIWVRAGTAWVNRDGSINVYLDVLPLDGKLHLREPNEETDGKARTQAGKGAASEPAAA